MLVTVRKKSARQASGRVENEYLGPNKRMQQQFTLKKTNFYIHMNVTEFDQQNKTQPTMQRPKMSKTYILYKPIKTKYR